MTHQEMIEKIRAELPKYMNVKKATNYEIAKLVVAQEKKADLLAEARMESWKIQNILENIKQRS